MNKETICIKGMHCRSCEILIEEELMKVPGVKKVKISHKKGTADLYHEGHLDSSQIEDSVRRAGYELGEEKRTIISKDIRQYRDLGVAFLIVFGLFFVAKSLGIFNITIGSGKSFANLAIVFIIGLTAGVSTCMALVGGLIMGASAKFAKAHPAATTSEKFKPHLFFNLGRIISYTLFGAVIGYAGSVFRISSSVTGILTIMVGVVMILLGAQLIDIFPILKGISFTLPTWITRRLGLTKKKESDYSHRNSAIMGALTFFVPCGFTQAMQLYAMSTGNPMSGALTLGTFALGTAPGLLGIGGLTSIVKGKIAQLFFKSAGIAVIGLAIFNISNGFSLAGYSVSNLFAPSSSASTAAPVSGNTVNGVQIINMSQNSRGYEPNVLTVKKGVPVRWIIDSKDSYTCASSLIVPKLSINKSLSLGENVIEFTPTESGSINFSCSMGMYRGKINVLEDDSQPAANVGSSDLVPSPKTPADTQVVKLGYTIATDITPKQIIVPVGKPVRIEIEAKEDGQGCMGSVTIPGLSEKVELLEKDKTAIFDVNAQKSGTYYITCGTADPRAQITVL